MHGTKHSVLLFSFYVLVFTLIAGCNKDRSCDVPIGESRCTLDLTLPSNSSLLDINGYLYIHGGNKGICLTHPSINEFVALERTCPNDHGTAVVMRDDSDGLILECPVCGSRFLSIDGTPLDGSATSCSLYQYSTRLDGTLLDVW